MVSPALVARARAHLAPILELSGKLLYSAADTLTQGDLYILGLNPGGDPSAEGHWTVQEALDQLPVKSTNDYLDESWRGAAPGTRPLQRRLRWLVEKLGYDFRRVCASNLIFARSRHAAGARYPELARICWPVHEEILGLVQPRVVLAFGNSHVSPFQFIHELVGKPALVRFPSGHGRWVCKAFAANLPRERCVVVGLPHLSRYQIEGKHEVVEWISHFLRA